MDQTVHTLQYGDTVIEYQLSYAQRKTLGISVLPDLTVEVKAPVEADFHTIEEMVHKRANWILRQQRAFETYLPHMPPRRYVSGETHRYLGRQYRLKVIEDEHEDVKLKRGRLFVWVRDKEESERVQTLVQEWYRGHARRVFQERLDACYPRVERLGIPYPPIAIRTMKTRWGSCTPSGTISLNLKLMQVPKACIDYVLLHELCHLKEHHHGPAFYQLLDRVLPDWRERKEQLNACEVA